LGKKLLVSYEEKIIFVELGQPSYGRIMIGALAKRVGLCRCAMDVPYLNFRWLFGGADHGGFRERVGRAGIDL
jgi:hypothetical protein